MRTRRAFLCCSLPLGFAHFRDTGFGRKDTRETKSHERGRACCLNSQPDHRKLQSQLPCGLCGAVLGATGRRSCCRASGVGWSGTARTGSHSRGLFPLSGPWQNSPEPSLGRECPRVLDLSHLVVPCFPPDHTQLFHRPGPCHLVSLSGGAY